MGAFTYPVRPRTGYVNSQVKYSATVWLGLPLALKWLNPACLAEDRPPSGQPAGSAPRQRTAGYIAACTTIPTDIVLRCGGCCDSAGVFNPHKDGICELSRCNTGWGHSCVTTKRRLSWPESVAPARVEGRGLGVSARCSANRGTFCTDGLSSGRKAYRLLISCCSSELNNQCITGLNEFLQCPALKPGWVLTYRLGLHTVSRQMVRDGPSLRNHWAMVAWPPGRLAAVAADSS